MLWHCYSDKLNENSEKGGEKQRQSRKMLEREERKSRRAFEECVELNILMLLELR